MYKEVLSATKDVSIYPIISLIVFVVFFSIIIWWVFKSTKEDFDTISQLPLQEETLS